jgi:hypothetical protein
MRRSTTRWLPLLVTPLFALSLAGSGSAAAITYTTSGQVGALSDHPTGYISFNSTSGTLVTPGVVSLGTFVAQTIPDGLGITFNQLPFTISVVFHPQDSSGLSESKLSIAGVLNGALQGSTTSSVVATVSSVQASAGPGPLPFPVDTFSVSPQTIAPSEVNGGVTPLMGLVTSAAVPEPAPLALVGMLAGWAALRLRRTGRRSPIAGTFRRIA